mmetsp:Transcript_906/g.2407  ORF Transcript_906/g.2407 Transcript_906/m.2407 type:complete len:209 (+) Transcript_906:828-1454(+)
MASNAAAPGCTRRMARAVTRMRRAYPTTATLRWRASAASPRTPEPRRASSTGRGPREVDATLATLALHRQCVRAWLRDGSRGGSRSRVAQPWVARRGALAAPPTRVSASGLQSHRAGHGMEAVAMSALAQTGTATTISTAATASVPMTTTALAARRSRCAVAWPRRRTVRLPRTTTRRTACSDQSLVCTHQSEHAPAGCVRVGRRVAA